MAYDRNASARSKGYRNYYEYRKAQSQAKGFETPYQEQKAGLGQIGFTPYTYRRYRQELEESGEVFLPQRNPLADYLRNTPLWDEQVPPSLQNSPHLQKAFNEGFLKPIGINTPDHRPGGMTDYQREQRAYFLSIIDDWDWDAWRDFVDEEGYYEQVAG